MIYRRLILACALLLWSVGGWGSQVAEVAKEEILVYADDTTQIPVGKLTAGAKVHIAHKTRRGGTVIPAYVSGKLVYLKTEDIILYSASNNITEHRIVDDAQSDDEELDKAKYFTFTYHKMDLGKKWRRLSALVNDEQVDYFDNYVFSLDYRRPKSRYIFGAGLGYYLQDQQTYGFEGLTGELSAGYIPWQWKFMSYEVLATGIFSGAWRIRYRNAEGAWIKNRIMAWGYMLSAQVKFFPYDKFSGTIGWSYKYIFMKSSEVFVYNDESNEETSTKIYAAVPRIGGASFYLALSYRF